jgi:Tol biopolymer transport system component
VGGRSAIFTVPIQVERPTPDAVDAIYLRLVARRRFLVYTGARNDEFDIYESAEGGAEVRLTAQGLDDGPDTPDGNTSSYSSRNGTMQIWKMKSGSNDQQPVTNDEYNNWFPHISPDGEWVAFLSFSKEVSPSDHPYYKQVYLRLMPVEGGVAKVIAYVYGGQGTINVPSWSPDSRMLAFVSNTGM